MCRLNSNIINRFTADSITVKSGIFKRHIWLCLHKHVRHEKWYVVGGSNLSNQFGILYDFWNSRIVLNISTLCFTCTSTYIIQWLFNEWFKEDGCATWRHTTTAAAVMQINPSPSCVSSSMYLLLELSYLYLEQQQRRERESRRPSCCPLMLSVDAIETCSKTHAHTALASWFKVCMPSIIHAYFTRLKTVEATISSLPAINNSLYIVSNVLEKLGGLDKIHIVSTVNEIQRHIIQTEWRVEANVLCTLYL